MPATTYTQAGCPKFTGTVFKDYLDNEFKTFLRQRGIARVLDPGKDPRKRYTLPEVPSETVPGTPFTAIAPSTVSTRGTPSCDGSVV